MTILGLRLVPYATTAVSGDDDENNNKIKITKRGTKKWYCEIVSHRITIPLMIYSIVYIMFSAFSPLLVATIGAGFNESD